MKPTLRNAIIKASLALPLAFLGPIITTIGFKAMEDTLIPLILGVIIDILALFLGISGLIDLLKSLFNRD